jgi:hypothetical protein
MVSRNLMLLMTAVAVATGLLITAFYEAPARFPAPPAGKTYFGVQLDHEFDDITGYAARLGSTPALYGRYVNFPLSTADQEVIAADVKELAPLESSLMLTLEPRKGLTVITPQSLQDLTDNLVEWNRKGVPVLIRFAHEMNGSWYPWGQKPALFIEKFRQVAAAVHQAPSSSMLWSPNEGAGYPYAGGEHEYTSGSDDMHDMDTDGDGMVTGEDDPYAPYWPGDDAVDWVGLSLYHFGEAYPWGENTVPEPGKLADKIRGTFNSAHVDDTAVPNFYKEYAEGHEKPFALSETGAFYNTSRTDGASALAIKQAWWEQLTDPKLQKHFPRLQLAVWFEFSKLEKQPENPVVDWRTTTNPMTRDPFTSAIASRFTMAPLK